MGADSAGPARALAGKRVLVVEDETLIAMLLEDMIRDLGGTVAGSAARMEQARDMVRDSSLALDLAVLDVNIGGENSFPLASILSERGLPFAFSTGYGSSSLPEAWRGRPTLQKPFTIEQVEAVLSGLLAAGR